MPHRHIRAEARIFDIVHARVEYWRIRLGNQSRSKFYGDALVIMCNMLARDYPELAKKEAEYISSPPEKRREILTGLKREQGKQWRIPPTTIR